MTLFWVGVQSSEDRKESIFFTELSCHRKFFSLRHLLEIFCYKGWMGHTRMMRVIENYISKKKFMESFFDEKVFSKTLLSVGVQRTDQGKEFLFLGETLFFTEFCFLWNNLIRLVSFSNGCTHKWWLKEKKFLKKNLSKCSFNKEIWITLLSARLQRANT